MDTYIGLNKYKLDTPVLVIDKAKLLSNINHMQEFAESHQIDLRPHAKTHKCSQIAQLQLEYGAVGICVAKVSEGYELAKTGIKGILITSPVVTKTKIEILLKILESDPGAILVIDNIDNAIELNRVLVCENKVLNVLMDIDSGQLRTGVLIDNALEFARDLNQLSNLNFIGIQCYAGHIQHIADLTMRSNQSMQILERVGQIKLQLLSEGINCRIQTGSGTGTFSIDAKIKGVTEIQPGSYTVMDSEYLDINYAETVFVPALTMLTTVISTNHASHVTVDAGSKSMYIVDTKPQIVRPKNLKYDWVFGDEHGKVTSVNGAALPMLGDVLELVVAHCDPTINLFDHFYITQNDIVVERWDINLRGKSG